MEHETIAENLKGWVKSVQQDGKPPRDYKEFIGNLEINSKPQDVVQDIVLAYQTNTYEHTPQKKEQPPPRVLTRSMLTQLNDAQSNTNVKK